MRTGRAFLLYMLSVGAACAASSPAKPHPVDDPAARALCKGIAPCEVREILPAGKGLKVVRLWVGDAMGEGDDKVACGRFAEEPGRMQYWLLGGKEGNRKLLDLCNDGYGASGVGEDDVTVGDNELEHAQSGGSAWRWSDTVQVRLEPLSVLSSHAASYWNISENNSETTWDWQAFRGKADWFVPMCGPDGKAPEPESIGGGDVSYPYSPIPRIPAEALPKGADQLALGSCSIQIGADGAGGFPLRGKEAAGQGSSAWMRLLGIGDDELLITVGGTHWTHGAANWIHDDHLELWLSPSLDDGCIGKATPLSQWGLGIADGALHPGYHADPANAPVLIARREGHGADGDTVTFQLRLPKELPAQRGLAIVLSLGDGSKQLRMAGTSPVKYGKVSTLGGFYEIGKGAVRCAANGGVLEREASGLPALLEQRFAQ